MEAIFTTEPDHQPPLRFAYVRDPAPLAKTLVGFLWAEILLSILNAALGLTPMARALAERDSANMVVGPFELAMALTLMLVGSAAGICSMITGVLFLKWLYRINLNWRGFGIQGLRYTPGWVVGWWIVPFANFIMPYRVVAELHRVGSNPLAWRNLPIPHEVIWWWVIKFAPLLAMLTILMVVYLTEGLHPAAVKAGMEQWNLPLTVLGLAVVLVHFRLTLRLVRRFVADQQRWVAAAPLPSTL